MVALTTKKNNFERNMVSVAMEGHILSSLSMQVYVHVYMATSIFSLLKGHLPRYTGSLEGLYRSNIVTNSGTFTYTSSSK